MPQQHGQLFLKTAVNWICIFLQAHVRRHHRKNRDEMVFQTRPTSPVVSHHVLQSNVYIKKQLALDMTGFAQEKPAKWLTCDFGIFILLPSSLTWTF